MSHESSRPWAWKCGLFHIEIVKQIAARKFTLLYSSSRQTNRGPVNDFRFEQIRNPDRPLYLVSCRSAHGDRRGATAAPQVGTTVVKTDSPTDNRAEKIATTLQPMADGLIKMTKLSPNQRVWLNRGLLLGRCVRRLRSSAERFRCKGKRENRQPHNKQYSYRQQNTRGDEFRLST